MKSLEVLATFLKAYEAMDIDTIASMLAENVRLQDWNLTAQGKDGSMPFRGAAKTRYLLRPERTFWT